MYEIEKKRFIDDKYIKLVTVGLKCILFISTIMDVLPVKLIYDW